MMRLVHLGKFYQPNMVKTENATASLSRGDTVPLELRLDLAFEQTDERRTERMLRLFHQLLAVHIK